MITTGRSNDPITGGEQRRLRTSPNTRPTTTATSILSGWKRYLPYETSKTVFLYILLAFLGWTLADVVIYFEETVPSDPWKEDHIFKITCLFLIIFSQVKVVFTLFFMWKRFTICLRIAIGVDTILLVLFLTFGVITRQAQTAIQGVLCSLLDILASYFIIRDIKRPQEDTV